MPTSSLSQFSLKTNTKALLTFNIFTMDNYLIMSPGSTLAKSSINLPSYGFCGTGDRKAHLITPEVRQHYRNAINLPNVVILGYDIHNY